MKAHLGIIDLETGGLDPNKHPITQISIDIITPLDFTTIHTFDTFIKPYNNLEISDKALEHSRVSMKDINKGLDKVIFMRELINCFKIANKSGKGQTKLILVGHNVGFDIGFLEYFFTHMNKNLYDFISRTSIDTMLMAKLMEVGTLKSSENQKYNLTALCERWGITLHSAHGAAADVQATKQVLIKILNSLRYGLSPSNSTASIPVNHSRKKARDSFFFEF